MNWLLPQKVAVWRDPEAAGQPLDALVVLDRPPVTAYRELHTGQGRHRQIAEAGESEEDGEDRDE